MRRKRLRSHRSDRTARTGHSTNGAAPRACRARRRLRMSARTRRRPRRARFHLGVEARVSRHALSPLEVHLQAAVFFFDLDDVEGRVFGQPRRDAVDDAEPPVADLESACGESARRARRRSPCLAIEARVLFEERERVLRRQVEPAPPARGGGQPREEPLHPRSQALPPRLFRRAGIALDRPVPLALRVLARLPAPFTRDLRFRHRLRQGGVRGLLDLIGGQGAQLKVDPEQAKLLLDLADDEVRIGGQLRRELVDDGEPAVAAGEALTGERRRRRDGRGVGQSGRGRGSAR
jgi:hypothetical protein